MPLILRILPGQSVKDLPRVTLIRWRAMMTEGNDVHLVGYALETARGRVSTPLHSLDPLARVAVTASGRAYTLSGPPGCEPTAVQIWSASARLHGIERWRDITEAISKALAAPTNGRTLAEVLAAIPDVGRDADSEQPDDTEASP